MLLQGAYFELTLQPLPLEEYPSSDTFLWKERSILINTLFHIKCNLQLDRSLCPGKLFSYLSYSGEVPETFSVCNNVKPTELGIAYFIQDCEKYSENMNIHYFNFLSLHKLLLLILQPKGDNVFWELKKKIQSTRCSNCFVFTRQNGYPMEKNDCKLKMALTLYVFFLCFIKLVLQLLKVLSQKVAIPILKAVKLSEKSQQ